MDVKFAQCSQSKYDEMYNSDLLDNGTIYFIMDGGKIYVGSTFIANKENVSYDSVNNKLIINGEEYQLLTPLTSAEIQLMIDQSISGKIEEAPIDGEFYGRMNGRWWEGISLTHFNNVLRNPMMSRGRNTISGYGRKIIEVDFSSMGSDSSVLFDLDISSFTAIGYMYNVKYTIGIIYKYNGGVIQLSSSCLHCNNYGGMVLSPDNLRYIIDQQHHKVVFYWLCGMGSSQGDVFGGFHFFTNYLSTNLPLDKFTLINTDSASAPDIDINDTNIIPNMVCDDVYWSYKKGGGVKDRTQFYQKLISLIDN